MSIGKPRTRLYIAGEATYRLISPDRGYGGPYGADRRPAKWACVGCGQMVDGTDTEPWVKTIHFIDRPDGFTWSTACARNGHAPCRACGRPLARLNDGCPREHRWTECPGKTEADRMQPQHAHKGHLSRVGAR